MPWFEAQTLSVEQVIAGSVWDLSLQAAAKATTLSSPSRTASSKTSFVQSWDGLQISFE